LPARWSVEYDEEGQPACEPVDLATARAHLRVNEGYADDDSIIALYLQAAREWVEDYINRTLITSTRVLWYDTFAPAEGWPATLWIPYGPVQTINKLSYFDPGGTETELTVGLTDDGVVDVVLDKSAFAPRIVPRYNRPWPISKIFIKQVKVNYDCGYGDAPKYVPAAIRSAVLLRLTDLYEYRSDSVAGATFARTQAAERLLANYRDHSNYSGD